MGYQLPSTYKTTDERHLGSMQQVVHDSLFSGYAQSFTLKPAGTKTNLCAVRECITSFTAPAESRATIRHAAPGAASMSSAQVCVLQHGPCQHVTDARARTHVGQRSQQAAAPMHMMHAG